VTEAATLPSDVGAALSLVDACESDPDLLGQAPLPSENARRLEDLVARAVKMAGALKDAWQMLTQQGTVWESGLYLRRLQTIAFSARVVVDVLSRTLEIVSRTNATHLDWRPPPEMADVQANLPVARDIFARAQELWAARFHELANRWKGETQFYSSRTKMVDHPAYREIIGMGLAAIPLILDELRTDPHFWFPALQAITGIDPVPVEHRGLVRQMADAWLQWGKTHGF